MSQTLLRRMLEERSAHPPATIIHHQGRAAGVRRKVLARRRRRIGAGAGAVVLAAGLLGMAVPQVLGGADSAPDGDMIDPAGGFPEYLDGTRVVASGSAPLADRSFTFVFASTASDLVLYTRCDDHGVADGNLGLNAEFSVGNKTVERRLCLFAPAGGGDGLDTWETFGADTGIEAGETAAVTITLTEVAPQAVAVDELPSLPSQGTMAVAVGEAVPFEEYPLPAPPAALVPLPETGSPDVELRADPTDPNRRVERTMTWNADLAGCDGSIGLVFPLELASQTPGTLRVLIDEVEVAQHTWWDYRQKGTADRLDPLCSELSDGDEVTIAAEPEHMTGEWQVVINRAGG